MIVKYYRGNLSLDKISDLCKTTRTGTSAYHIIKAAEDLGFRAKGLKCDFESLCTRNLIFPAIVHVTLEKTYAHYMVVYEVDMRHQYIVVGDPSSCIKKIPFKEFERIYNETILLFTPIQIIKHEGNEISVFPFLKNLLYKYKREFIHFLFFSFLFSIASIGGTFYCKIMLGQVERESSFATLLFSFLLFILLSIFHSVSFFLRNYILMHLEEKIDFILTTEIFSSLLSLPYLYYRNRTTGEILSKNADAVQVKNLLGELLICLFIDIPLSFLSFGILFFLQKQMIWLLFVYWILYFIVLWIQNPFFHHVITQYQNKKGNVESLLVEAIEGYETVKGIHIERYLQEKFKHAYLHFLGSVRNLVFRSHVFATLGMFLSRTSEICIIFMGCLFIEKGSLHVQDLITYLFLISYFFLPIQTIGKNLPKYKEAVSALKRISMLPVETKELGYACQPFHLEGKFVFSHLTYTYNDQEPVLEDLCFEITSRTKVLLLGPSGTGKSTILKLLMQYDKVGRNMIYIDTFDLLDIKKSTIEKDICYISQNETLFTGSLYENITLGAKVDAKKLNYIIKICEVEEIIGKNPLGLHMLIEENGFNLSGGEKQRIVLARTLLRSFTVLLLDEALSEVDAIREKRILTGIFSYCHRKTIVVVSHRSSSIELFDQILRLEDRHKIWNIKKGINGKYRVCS